MRALAVLLLLAGSAQAQTQMVFTPNGLLAQTCEMNGIRWLPSNGICYWSQSGTVVPLSQTLTIGETSVTGPRSLWCEPGSELIQRSSGAYGCAKDIAEPRQ